MKIRDILESATAGATSSGNIATVVSPHLANRKAGKVAPKAKMQKPGTNALDSKSDIFGAGIVVKR
jgi:hypothetical protein